MLDQESCWSVHLQSGSVWLLCLPEGTDCKTSKPKKFVCMCPKASSPEVWFEVGSGVFSSYLAKVLLAILNTVRATQTGCGCSTHLQDWLCPIGNEGRTEICLTGILGSHRRGVLFCWCFVVIWTCLPKFSWNNSLNLGLNKWSSFGPWLSGLKSIFNICLQVIS